MTRRFDEWLEVSEIEPSHKFRWRTHYRKCPRRGQSEEEDAVKDAPNVGAAAMATEVLVSAPHRPYNPGRDLSAWPGWPAW